MKQSRMTRCGSWIGMLVAVMLVMEPVAYASDSVGGYIGAGAGRSGVDIDEAQFDSLAAASSTASDETDTGVKLFVGQQFTKHLAVELAYVDLGKFTASQTISNGTVDVEYAAKGWSLAGIGIMALSKNASLFGKLGVFRWTLDYRCTTASGTAACLEPADRSASGTDLSYGVGASYDFTQSLGLRIEWERFRDVGAPNDSRGTDNGRTGRSDTDLLTIGFRYAY